MSNSHGTIKWGTKKVIQQLIEEDLDTELERDQLKSDKLHELYDEVENYNNPERLEQLIEEMKSMKKKRRKKDLSFLC